jgi:integrase
VTLLKLDPDTRRLRRVTKKEAQRLFDELILDKLEIGNINPQSLATLGEFVSTKFDPSLELKSRKQQEHVRNMLCNHVLPTLGGMRMRDIRFDHVQALIFAKVAAGLSSQTITHVRTTVSMLFKAARLYGWYNGDKLTEGLEMPDLTHRKRTALTSDQIQTLLENCDLLMYTIVLADSILGLRRGELAGLRCKYLNLSPQPTLVDGEVIPPFTVAVREQYVWVFGKHIRKEQRGWRYQRLKTDNATRNVPITPALVDAFKELRKRDRFVGPDDAVFVGRTGETARHAQLPRRSFQTFTRETGITTHYIARSATHKFNPR